MSRCRSCDALIVWVETEATAAKPGRKMPLDADGVGHARVVADGNVVFTGARTADGTPIVRYDKAKGLHVSHFATCPHAGAHRRRS